MRLAQRHNGANQGSLGTAAVLVTGAFGALYVGQTALIYPTNIPPGSRENVPTPRDFGLPYDDVDLITPDNVKLKAYLLLQGKSKSGSDSEDEAKRISKAASCPTILMFHANAGNVGHRIPFAQVFYNKMKCNVFMLSYRGYGKSEGTPSEKGLKIDAQAALKWVTSHPLLRDTKIFLYGQSIGGAVAIDLASHHPELIHAVIIENTFLSIRKLIPTVLPLLSPFTFLCHQLWDSSTRIALIPSSMPMLFLAGKSDELIPPIHMRTLFEIASNAETPEEKEKVWNGRNSDTRWWWETETGRHNDTCIQPGYWQEIADFIVRWR